MKLCVYLPNNDVIVTFKLSDFRTDWPAISLEIFPLQATISIVSVTKNTNNAKFVLVEYALNSKESFQKFHAEVFFLKKNTFLFREKYNLNSSHENVI